MWRHIEIASIFRGSSTYIFRYRITFHYLNLISSFIKLDGMIDGQFLYIKFYFKRTAK